ncbi:phosphoribosylanthranilate isomerase [Candidatus Pandoraea novymonadis]|uniref:N-(5'-phosphoribosyl)anthranilate isomerase n=1 Tax=Candidatus Pandoraea novymonadis TaxID=1808959 RepID=A0ABX5FG49_9BURK|nr:phosphoribosylanthranilate isomerase [Candidatus Pandoraea novymonadis]PSB92202.1 N-(5'-phosphoribosyl)anthranilate isomerase [Candidatus Pandoraea novymonadis]
MERLNVRTRIKICGLTRPADVDCAVALGVDAIGLVFYRPSPRNVTIEQAMLLARRVPPFVTLTGLFVNISEDEIRLVAQAVPLALLQFHGDETPEQCEVLAAAAGYRPWIRAMRISTQTHCPADLIQFEEDYVAAQGILLDALVHQGYGGGGKVFDWSLIPENIAHRVILSGGLNVSNVAEAVVRVQPYAVDVSSGVEVRCGVKDHARMTAFVRAVSEADAR